MDKTSEKKGWLATCFKGLLGLIPAETVKFFYLKILKPKPLRWMADRLIKMMTPAELILPEGRVILDRDDPGISGSLALGAHDSFEIELFRKSLRQGMTVIDVGANIGYYTVIAAGRVGRSGRVFAYEPEEKNFAMLSKNVGTNGFTQVKAIKTALSDKVGTRALFLADKHAGIHSFANNRDMTNKIEIETDTLDHSLEGFGSPKIDLIKMDIEGAEVLALDGMKRTVGASPRMILFIECYPEAIERLGHKPIELLKKLSSLGFSLSAIEEDEKKIIPLPEKGFEGFLARIPRKREAVKNLYAVKNK